MYLSKFMNISRYMLLIHMDICIKVGGNVYVRYVVLQLQLKQLPKLIDITDNSSTNYLRGGSGI